MTLPFGAASFHLALMSSEKTGGFASTATKTTIPKHCRHPFITASGCLNPELGQLGDDDAHRRWQTRMVYYRRDDKSSRPNNHKKNRRHLSGQSRGYHQDQGQVNCHNDTTYTSDHHGGILCSLASSAPAPARRMRFGAAHNLGENTLARQPGIFDNGNRQLDGVTAPSTTLSGGTYFGFRRCSSSVASLSSNAGQIASVKSPRAPTPSADDSHGVVPAAETSASSVVSSSQVIFYLFIYFRRRETRASSDVPLSHGLSSATGTTRPAPFPSAAA